MRRKVIVLVVLLLAAGGGVVGWRHLHPPVEPGVIILNGNVDIRQVDLSFRVEGRVAEVRAEEGDRVTTGQVVAVVDKVYLENAVHLAESQVAAAEANLAKLQAGNRPQEIAQSRADVGRAEATYANAKATYERRSALQMDSFVSRQDLDNALSAKREAEANLKRAREAQSLSEKGFRAEDIDVARAQLSSEKATLELMQRRLADAELVAPSDGMVMTRVREPGSMVMAGNTVLTLALTEPMQVRTWIPETALGEVVPGTAAEIITDGGGKVYHGQVGFVSPVAEFTPKTVETTQLRTSLVYRLRVVVSDPDQGLRQGMPVTVRLRSKK